MCTFVFIKALLLGDLSTAPQWFVCKLCHWAKNDWNWERQCPFCILSPRLIECAINNLQNSGGNLQCFMQLANLNNFKDTIIYAFKKKKPNTDPGGALYLCSVLQVRSSRCKCIIGCAGFIGSVQNQARLFLAWSKISSLCLPHPTNISSSQELVHVWPTDSIFTVRLSSF